MALPAGRYGVTKNQLLKIKKLPMNTMGMIKDTKEGIAIIEDGAKASQLITADRQFWHNGKLYSADENIAKDADIITSGEGKNATEMPNITDQLPGTDAEKANEITIARVENGTNPTATINAGEQFYHSGILYTATTDIATTDTFIVYPTANYNCKLSDSVTGQIKAIKDDLDGLGTASTKNSTSVVTDSSDLVESGAVKDIIGWGNKNLTAWKWNTFTADSKLLITLNKGTYTISAQSTIPNGTTFIRGTKQDSSYCSKAELGVGDWTDSATAGVYATTELLSSYTFSVPENNVLIEFGRTNCNGTIPAQLEKGNAATTYEPYHASVAVSLEDKADNSVIGTVEDGATASQAYTAGSYFQRNGKLGKAINDGISNGGQFNLGTNYIETTVAAELKALADAIAAI